MAMTTKIRQPLDVVEHVLATLISPQVICCLNFPCSARNSLGCASKAASNSCSANQPKANLFCSWFSICSSTTREENCLFLTTVRGASHQFQQQKASDPFSSALLHPASLCGCVPWCLISLSPWKLWTGQLILPAQHRAAAPTIQPKLLQATQSPCAKHWFPLTKMKPSPWRKRGVAPGTHGKSKNSHCQLQLY